VITEWRLSNFKSVRRETNIRLAPLTIFAGANSSGKSSLIQSMLLISQSLTSQVVDRPILLNGPLVRLGNFDDIRSFGGGDSISIGWTAVGELTSAGRLPQGDNVVEGSCDITIAVESAGKSIQISQLNPRLISARLATTAPDPSELALAVVVNRLHELPAERQQQLLTDFNPWGNQEWFQYDARLDAATEALTLGSLEGVSIVGCFNRHFVTVGVFARINRIEHLIMLYTDFERVIQPQSPLMQDLVEKPLLDLIKAQLSQDELHSLGFGRSRGLETSRTISAWRTNLQRFTVLGPTHGNAKEALAHLTEVVKSYFETSKQTHAIVYQQLQGPLFNASQYMVDRFPSSISYLGPLRDEPRPLQPLSSTAEQKSVGLRGEQSAAVYNLYRATPVTYISSAAFSSADELTVTRAPLRDALLDWLHYMDLAEDVQVEDRGKHGHELRLTTAGVTTLHDLTHVGVGVSQVFPIILTCLLADADTTLIFEQPELHLHPKVQARLGDFFLSVALAGKQCLIETHSEYVVNRLRYRAAAMRDRSAIEATKIYFVEKENGSTSFRELNINEFGAIPDWPRGFFDQSQEEAENILNAAIDKRRTK
jgi:predicted ATPase